MSKERRTVTLDSAIQDRLNEPGVNASGLVNQLLRSHFGEGSEKQRLEIRRDRLKDELEELQTALEAKRDQLERVEERLHELGADYSDTLSEADTRLPDSRTIMMNFKPPESHPGVEKFATEAGVSPKQFWTDLQDARTDNTQHE